jgi:hypothetical protein
MSTFTPNKSIEQPAHGADNNTWDIPANADWAIIDTAFGGNVTISVTGLAAGGYVLTLPQYQPPNIIFTGTIGGNLLYAFPEGVGGLWSVFNNTTGAFTLTMECDIAGFSSVVVPQGQRAFVVSDGNNVSLAQSVAVSFSQISGQVSNAQVPEGAVTQYQAGLFIETAQLTGTVTAAQVGPLPASQITSGTLANAQLPNVAAGPGVTIAADPGTTPSGTFGDIFFYY